MRDLLELVQIVTRQKLRFVELLSGELDSGSKLQEFYDLLSEERFQNDEEAARHFYQDGKRSPGYQKLRKTLKDRLINSLYIIDLKQPSYTDRQRAYYECYKEWAAAKVLFGKNARTAAAGLALKLLKIAGKYEFTELMVDICHTLRLYYGTIEGDFKKYQKYNDKFKRLEKIWLEENRAEEFYIELSIAFVNSKATKIEFQDIARKYFEEVRESLAVYDAYHLHLCGRLIEISIYTSVNDYEGTLDVCERSIQFFEEKPYVANVPLQVFHYQKFICFVQTRSYKEALKEAELCLKYMEEGSFNWFKLYELYFILYLHQEKYPSAAELFRKIINHPAFDTLPDHIRETWRISEAYLYFLQKMGALNSEAFSTEGSPFHLSDFLNDISLYSKDKQGMNIPILQAELMIRLAEKDYDGIIDRYEAIEKYRQRYLREEETARSNYFMQLLLLIPKYKFNWKEIRQRSAPLLKALRQIPIEVAYQTHEIEIMPYENVWDMIMESISKNS